MPRMCCGAVQGAEPNVNRLCGLRADSQLAHVEGWSWIEQRAALCQRNHGHGAGLAGGARCGAIQGVYRDIDGGQAADAKHASEAMRFNDAQTPVAHLPSPMRSPQNSIGALSFSPSPMTTTPSNDMLPSTLRMASTAAPSAASFWPFPSQCAAASAAASVTRTCGGAA